MNEHELHDLLHDAADDVTGDDALAGRAARAYRSRVARRRAVPIALGVVAVAGGAVVVANREGDNDRDVQVAGSTTTDAPAPARLSARLELASDTVVTGSTLQGELVIENNTGRDIVFKDENDCALPWTVTLSNDEIPNGPAFALMCAVVTAKDRIPPGVTRSPFSSPAIYLSCAADDGGAGLPKCEDDGRLAGLPPGEYRATLHSPSRLPIPSPSAAPVHVVAREVSARVQLPVRSVAAGSEIQGTLVIDNHSGAPIDDAPCGEQAVVYLTNGTASSYIHSEVDCSDPVPRRQLRVGETRRPFILHARYGTCQPGIECTPKQPLGTSFPPLPPGTYRVELMPGESGLPALPTTTIEVTAS